jgi:hypothetical protein
MNQLPAIKESKAVASGHVSAGVVPSIVAEAGEHASRRFLEFFAATIRNKNTRQAYYLAVTRFFASGERDGAARGRRRRLPSSSGKSPANASATRSPPPRMQRWAKLIHSQ